MNNPIRRFIFEWYWVLALLLVLTAVVVLFVQNVEKRWEISIAAASIAVGLVYFVQKQKLEEIQLFEKLFTKFNERYRALHKDLQEIKEVPSGTVLTLAQRETLDHYFNLCGEEYLFYQEGRILHRIWVIWCRGMWEYLQFPAICEYWRSEEAEDYNYSLTAEIIASTAGRSLPGCYQNPSK